MTTDNTPPTDERRACAVDAPCESCRRHIKDYGFYPDLPSHSHADNTPRCTCHFAEHLCKVPGHPDEGDRPAVTDKQVEAAWSAFGEWPDELTEPMRRTMRAALEAAAATRPAPAVTEYELDEAVNAAMIWLDANGHRDVPVFGGQMRAALEAAAVTHHDLTTSRMADVTRSVEDFHRRWDESLPSAAEVGTAFDATDAPLATDEQP